MIRKLLACLALLTGLAAAGAPAQAEMAGAFAARCEVSAVANAVERPDQIAAVTVPSGRLDRASIEKPAVAKRPRAVLATVFIGSDRTRE